MKIGKEKFLKLLDGSLYGSSPDEGYVKDSVFYHPVLAIKFDIDKAWNFKNYPDKLELTKTDANMTLRADDLLADDLENGLTAEKYLSNGINKSSFLSSNELIESKDFSYNDLKGHSHLYINESIVGKSYKRFTVIFDTINSNTKPKAWIAVTSFKNINDAFTYKNYSICNDTKETIRSNDKKFTGKFIPNCEPIFEIFDNKIYHLISVMHFNHYYAAFSIFKDNKLLGIGPKNFRKICKDDKYFLNEFSCSTHPHNYYIQLLTETGILGFLSFSIIYLLFFYLFLKAMINVKEKNRLCKIILLSSFLVNFLPFLPSGSLFNNWVSILYTFPLGFLLGLYQNI